MIHPTAKMSEQVNRKSTAAYTMLQPSTSYAFSIASNSHDWLSQQELGFLFISDQQEAQLLQRNSAPAAHMDGR